MTLEEAVAHPKVNVFDIFEDKKSNYKFGVYTYQKPNESFDDWHDRDNRNFEWALKLKKRNQ